MRLYNYRIISKKYEIVRGGPSFHSGRQRVCHS